LKLSWWKSNNSQQSKPDLDARIYSGRFILMLTIPAAFYDFSSSDI
jgi:hypothetical protein